MACPPASTVIVSPACRLKALIGLPSLATTLVRSQPAGTTSLTEYVPGTNAPLSCGAA